MYLAIQQIYDELGAVSTEQIPEMLQSAYVDGLQHAIEQLGKLGIGMLTSNETIGDITKHRYMLRRLVISLVIH